VGKSLMEHIALLSPEEQKAVLADMDLDQLVWDWASWARPEQIAPEGKDWAIWLVLAGRGFGKLFSMETQILYTDGRSTYFKDIGDIQTGDTIFDENGLPTRVLQAHVPDTPKRMFRLTFSDGSTLDAGEEHQWVTWTHADRKAYNRNVGGAKGLPENWPQWKSTISRMRLDSRIDVAVIDHALELVGAGMSVRKAATKLGVNRATLAPHVQAGKNLQSTLSYRREETNVGPKIRNTQEIVNSLTQGKRGDLNHSIPVAGNISTPIADLLIAPHLFGMWLGDGSSASGQFTQHRDDMTHLTDAISAGGYTTTEAKYPKPLHPNTGSVTAKGMSTSLRKIGVLGNKHIPAEYLYAAAEQRWELLAGLLDSDGFIDAKSGHIEFVNTNKNIADGVMFLARSLGQKPSMVEKKSHATAKDGTRTPGKLAYRITWRPTRNFFKLPRKATRFRPLGSQASRNFHRMIVSYEEITPVLSRCLTVDSPNSMYLAGEALIPTHNTRLAAEWVREKAKVTNEGKLRFALVARTAADVRDVLVEGESGIINVSAPSETPHYEPSKRRLTWPNGNTASLFCVTPDTEALTKDRGWVTHDNLSKGDEILTLNTDTGSSEWNPVKGVHTFDVVDETVARFSGRHHSSVSTLTHKWPVKLRNGEIKLTTTDSIIKGESHTKVRLITSAPCSDIPTASTHSDALVELCAWYMTEGSVKSKDFESKTGSLVLIDQPGWEKWLSDRIAPLRCHKKDGKPKIIKPTSTKNNGAWGMTNLIDICDKLGEDIEDALVFYHQRPRSVSLSIAQSMRVNPDKCASIRKALTDLFGPEREKTEAPGQKIKGESWIVRPDFSGKGVLNYYLDNDSSAKILEHFIDPVEKIPTIEFMNSLTVSQLEIFVTACMDGDGHRRGSSGSFEQKSEGRRDAFGYALALLGYSHSYTTRHPKYKGEPVTLYGAHYRGSAYTTLPRAANLQSSKGRAWGDGRSTYTLENYTGIVWCPTAKNKTWLARHDGKVFFTGNTADEPDGLRGPQFDYSWGDEIAAWRQNPDAAGMTAFDNLRVGTRLGANPQMIVTTTPKKVPVLYKLIEESKATKIQGSKVIIARGSTLDNAGNLSAAYLDTITGVYEGTALARQELYGEMLDDVEGALWTSDLVDQAREMLLPPYAPLRVIGVDPSVAENPRDECGIVVCASSADRDLYKRHAWVMEDASIHGSPEVWANKVVEMARKWGCPVVAEVNQGGALVRNAINSIDPSIEVLEVHSKQGKALRAEPIVLAYEQSRIHHVNYLPELESQMYSWIPGETRKSPDRVDAMVHAMTALLIKPPPGFMGGKLVAKSPAAKRLPQPKGPGARIFTR